MRKRSDRERGTNMLFTNRFLQSLVWRGVSAFDRCRIIIKEAEEDTMTIKSSSEGPSHPPIEHSLPTQLLLIGRGGERVIASCCRSVGGLVDLIQVIKLKVIIQLAIHDACLRVFSVVVFFDPHLPRVLATTSS